MTYKLLVESVLANDKVVAKLAFLSQKLVHQIKFIYTRPFIAIIS